MIKETSEKRNMFSILSNHPESEKMTHRLGENNCTINVCVCVCIHVYIYIYIYIVVVVVFPEENRKNSSFFFYSQQEYTKITNWSCGGEVQIRWKIFGCHNLPLWMPLYYGGYFAWTNTRLNTICIINLESLAFVK